MHKYQKITRFALGLGICCAGSVLAGCGPVPTEPMFFTAVASQEAESKLNAQRSDSRP